MEGIYRWSDGTLSTWDNWDRYYDQPNGHQDQNCLALMGNGQWQDRICDDAYRYICMSKPSKIKPYLSNMWPYCSFVLLYIILFLWWEGPFVNCQFPIQFAAIPQRYWLYCWYLLYRFPDILSGLIYDTIASVHLAGITACICLSMTSDNNSVSNWLEFNC